MIVFFRNIKHNLKARKMSIFKIAIACLLFLAISDKGLLQNTFNNLHNLFSSSSFSIESAITSMVNLSRIAMLDYTVTMGIGYMFVELAMYAVTALLVVAIITYFTHCEKVHEVRVSSSVIDVIEPHNDIYLKTSKFIC
ncbi:MAG: hypothetical protein E7356_05330 [Clostridiales bacterium]|nr:hypothetical protein [Clostridiales bacterium]